MTLVVLTTDTTHHAWFVDALRSVADVAAVFVEEDVPAPPFATHHPFEDARDDYERNVWFEGAADSDLRAGAPVIRVRRINDAATIERLRGFAPSIMLVFGTRKLSDEVIALCPDGLMNLHGGDPERHRGLDSHLWAIHEGAFDALVVTLHRVTSELDTGDIIARRPVPVAREMELIELRRRNTETCLDMSIDAIRHYELAGGVDASPQHTEGAYFSFMPAALKDETLRAFTDYTRTLP